MTKVVNLRKEPFDIYIGRGSKWGNPFTHLPLDETEAQFQVATLGEALAEYKTWILGHPDLVRALPELRGRTLGCFCKPRSCHGDILAALADLGLEQQPGLQLKLWPGIPEPKS